MGWGLIDALMPCGDQVKKTEHANHYIILLFVIITIVTATNSQTGRLGRGEGWGREVGS